MLKKKESKNKITDKKITREKLLKRIARIEGQVAGIRRMLEAERDCVDVVQQISAIRQAVATLGIELLKDDFLCKKNKHQEIDERYLKTLFKIN